MELLPLLIAHLPTRAAVAELVSLALGGGVGRVELSQPPTEVGPHVLELHAPGFEEPLVLQAEPAGRGAGGKYPLVLAPASPKHRRTLQAFVEAQALVSRLGATTSLRDLSGPGTQPPPAAEAAAPGGSPSPAPGQAASSVPLARIDLVTRRAALRSSVAREVGLFDSVRPARARASSHPPSFRPSSPGDDPLLGTTIGGGRYRIDALLGAGAMGRVYAATHQTLDKPIALKVLRSSLRDDPSFSARFRREALAASRLDHPNVTRVHDFGQEPGGVTYIAMDLLVGRDLEELLAQGGALEVTRALELMEQVCRGLAAAHARGVVHRDIKPGNIVLVAGIDDDGERREVVKVCDFGLASVMEAEREKEHPLESVDGTPYYMAPEQCAGAPADARADVYACGVILYELLTGELPFFDEDVHEVLRMHTAEPVPTPSSLRPEIPVFVDAIVLQAMAKQPGARFASARELRREVAQALAWLSPERAPALSVAPGPWGSDSSQRVSAVRGGEASLPSSSQRAPRTHLEAARGSVFGGSGPASLRVPGGPPSDLERKVAALVARPDQVLAAIDSLGNVDDYARAAAVLEHGADALTASGGAGLLARVVLDLARRREAARPGSDPIASVAGDTLQAVATPTRLRLLVAAALDEGADQVELCRQAVTALSTSGVLALWEALRRRHADPAARRALLDWLAERLRAEPATARALTDFGAELGAADALPLLQALLQAVPAESTAEVATELSAGLDQASDLPWQLWIDALPEHWGSAATPLLVRALAEHGEALGSRAVDKLRRLGGLGKSAVDALGPLLMGSSSAGNASRVAAARALNDVEASARPAAVACLVGAMEDATRLAHQAPSPTGVSAADVAEEVARTLLALGGSMGRRVVQRHADDSPEGLRARLGALLAGSE